MIWSADGRCSSLATLTAPAKTARLQHPIGLVYHDGLLYVTDTYNHKIKQIDPATGESTELAGYGGIGVSNSIQCTLLGTGGGGGGGRTTVHRRYQQPPDSHGTDLEKLPMSWSSQLTGLEPPDPPARIELEDPADEEPAVELAAQQVEAGRVAAVQSVFRPAARFQAEQPVSDPVHVDGCR